ncbi:MAG: OmpA family protein [Fusobacteriaceae bacterium]|jgi:chemotaxis protein MotB|nr:OmpA family protein [Fusobacteriaceae bacterium]
MKTKKIITAILLAGALFASANTYARVTKAGKGAAVGGIIGAGIGQAIGKNTKGTLIGAAAGTLVGASWGQYRENQEKEFSRRLRGSGVEVNRRGENLQLYLPSGVTFGTDQYRIRSQFYGVLDDIADVLIQYPESRIIVAGHTDSDGSADYNQDLSEKRANSVKNYLRQQGVQSRRITAVGYGESEPVSSNSTARGKARNRRVEIEILPPR